MSVNNELFQMWKRKELELGRPISASEIASSAGVHRDSVVRMLEDSDIKRYDANVVNAICRFFDVPDGPVPFIVYRSNGTS